MDMMELRGDCDGDHIMYFVFDGKMINNRHICLKNFQQLIKHLLFYIPYKIVNFD